MSIKLLKQKDFTLLMLGKLASLLGSNMQQFALSLYVLALTGSATIFASMLSISIIPRLLLSPVAGVFGDWFNRKITIVSLDFLNSIILALFAVVFFINGNLSLLMIYFLVIILEITEIFFDSSMAAVMPSIVKKDDYLEANTLRSLVTSIGLLLAPVLAAIIYGIHGLLLVLIINSVSFLLSAFSELFIKIPKNNNKPENVNLKAFKKDLLEGIRIIRSEKFISTIIGLATIINFSIVPLFSVGLIFIIKEVMLASDFQFGLFQMFLSSSLIVAPLLCSGFIKKIEIGKLSYISFLGVSILILLMAIIPSTLLLNNHIPMIVPYILIIIITFMIGIFVSIANISILTLFNKVVPLEMMGRTSAVLTLSVTIFIPFGQMLFGYLYDIIAPSYVIGLSGLIIFLALMKYRKSLLSVDRLEEENEGEITEEDIIDEGGVILNEL